MKDSSVARLLYARVKATMTLRKSGDLPSATGQGLRRVRLPAVLAGAAVLLLMTFAGGSRAGVSDYQGTLYLSGPPSAVSGSFRLLTVQGPGGAAVAPTALAGVANSGGITGSYSYIYVLTSGSGARSASAASPAVSVTNAPMTVFNVPVGAALYRQKGGGGSFFLIAASTAASPYIDTNPDPPVGTAVMANAENRVASFGTTTGYIDFSPGVGPNAAVNVPPTIGPIPVIPATCKGWTVDAAGELTFPSGPWSFTVPVKSNGSTSGQAFLVVGMWKVSSSGAPVPAGTILDPATASDGSQNLITLAAMTQVITYPAPASTITLPSFTLAADERICIQFWRHQKVAYSGGGASNRTLALLPYDDSNPGQVTHPAPNGFAAATLSAPADGLSTTSIPTLSATYSDPEADAGNLTIRLCSDPGCGTPLLPNSGAMAATNGATLNWTPGGPLGDGMYYWQAQAQDTMGLPSAWTSTRRFVIDNAAPDTTIDSGPTDPSNNVTPTFGFSSSEPGSSFECRVDGGGWSACMSPHTLPAMGAGGHIFDVRATDAAGNSDASPASYTWTIDLTAPDTTMNSNPPSPDNDSTPTFTFSSTEPGSSFECRVDGGSWVACSSPHTVSPAIPDGAHTFQARAVDAAGNEDLTPDSYSWTIDATPPDTTIGPSQPAPLTTATGATFDFSSTELPATFQCSLDGAAFAACTSPKAYSALADGSHTFQVRALDTATNADPSPASYTWTIDTTPPVTSFGTAKPSPNTSSSNATFDLASNEAGSTFECRLDGAPFGACTSQMTYTGLADGWHTFEVRATDPIGNVDTSPATYTWRIDNVAPSTPAPSGPAGGLVTNAPPLLRSTFSDTTLGGDTGTVEYRICSSAAPAGTACTPVVQTISSGSVSAGGSATATPVALPDGTYYWQARARDAAGNYSPWSATQSFQLDTIPPDVPVLGPPDDGAWVSKVQLGATFSKPSFAGTGTIEFRICSDGLCLGIVTGGTSESVINGGLATWAPSRSTLRNGLYYWQARAIDSAGNQSAWSDSRVLNVRRLAVRVKPKRVVCAAGSVLRLRIELSARAKVRNRLLTGRGRLVRRGGLRTMGAGATKVRVKLPGALRHGSYRLVFDATAPGEKARAVVTVKVGSRTCRAR
jgi:hypothetical protein